MQSARHSRPSFPHPGAGERARLRIAGVDRPIVTTVARRRDDALVVVQELPFLRVGSEVRDEDGRLARIVRVAVDLSRDQVPRLVLELAYEAEDDEDREGGSGVIEIDLEDREARRMRDATLGYETQRAAPAGSRGVTRRARSAEDTLLFATEAGAARDERPSTPPHLARRGSELELSLRALFMRIEAAVEALTRGLTQAFVALRTDP
ncbi:hypothetical protein [Sandaracinus amylolyticus]|uniref:Uncharacterized protein n=1 Tax=Sandaracinus amylolyticus TaxID=927083 RepID=A0A0F6W8G1_9BACT|nr:hypothetical protein [Sandaracinus amylolyticus]AKF09977.1 hypothetical protein DB32_007126 [Sandaracinus amylolyticus]